MSESHNVLMSKWVGLPTRPEAAVAMILTSNEMYRIVRRFTSPSDMAQFDVELSELLELNQEALREFDLANGGSGNSYTPSNVKLGWDRIRLELGK